MTHAHEDHSQGLNAVVRNFRPKQLWTGAVNGSGVGGLLAEARRSGAQILHPQAGYRRQFGSATVRVLAPTVDYVPGNTAKNNDSLVLEIAYGRRRFVLTGDAERIVEWELVAGGMLGDVDVLKVGHHGSKTSTTPELMQLTKPRFAMISVGDGNLYGHPHADVLSRLRDAHTQVFRTDRNGLTRFLTDGNLLVVETNSAGWQRD
jgi:competence protein ComEC